MKEILEKWSGKFEVNGEIYTNIDDLEFKDGEEFNITLLSKRRVVRDEKEDLLHA